MKTIAVLSFPKPVAELCALARFVVDRMTDNPYFPSPSPALHGVAARIAAVAAANAAVLTRAKGTRAARDSLIAPLKSDLRRLEAYLQSVADDHAADGVVIVASAGMNAKRPSIRTKPPLAVKPGPVSGTAEIIVKSAGDRAFYQCRYGTDQNTWALAPQTKKTRAVISGLTPATRHYFQIRVTTKDGLGDWGQVVSLIVV